MSDEVRLRLGQASFGKRVSVYFGSVCVFLLTATWLYRSGSAWPLAWLAAEIVLTGTRLAVMRASEKAAERGERGPVRALMPLGGLWSILFGVGCAMCLQSGIDVLAVIASLGVAAIVVSTASRNAATPRFAILCMLAVTGPWTLAALFSQDGEMLLVGLLTPVLLMGAIAMMYQNHRDLVRLVEAEHFSRLRSRTDVLTGLPNRAVLFESASRLCEMLATGRSDAPFCICSIDLDGFKAVNDTHGHATGDLLLMRVAERIKRAVREADTVCRIGGDEFVVIMPRTREEEANQIAWRIIRKVSKPYEMTDGTELLIGASIGSAEAPAHGLTVAALMARSDEALYAAKRGGRGRHVQAGRIDSSEHVLKAG